jgi:hypothetical protein
MCALAANLQLVMRLEFKERIMNRKTSFAFFLAVVFLAKLSIACPALAQTNTSAGDQALLNVESPDLFDSAFGFKALAFTTSGRGNTAVGASALKNNLTGSANTAVGDNALASTIGTGNIGLGFAAGTFVINGQHNIDIGNAGGESDSGTIRIGDRRHKATYIAGIFNSPVAETAVFANRDGKLGVMMSSARYKRDIHDMGAASNNLMKLRPVTFRYKDDPGGSLQYGLVAEEVEKLYPELVTHSADGQAQSVRYTMLIGMLVNELQKQRIEDERLNRQIGRLSVQMVMMKRITGRRLAAMEDRLEAMDKIIQAQSGDRKMGTQLLSRDVVGAGQLKRTCSVLAWRSVQGGG